MGEGLLIKAYKEDRHREILELITAESARERNEDGNLPLHFFVGTFDEQVIKKLLKVYPGAAKVKTNKFSLPLHVAVSYRGTTCAVTKMTYDAYPDAVKERGKFGDLPLHCAATGRAPEEVFKMVLEKYRIAVRQPNYKYELPLHIAVAGDATEVVKVLIEKTVMRSNGELIQRGKIKLATPKIG